MNEEKIELNSLSQVMQNTINQYRETWAKLAKKNGWYSDPFYIQVWINPERDTVMDVVAHKGLTEDAILIDDDIEGEWN